MRKFAVMAERAVQTSAALAALIFFVFGVVYLYLGRWTVTMLDFWRIYDFCLNHTWLESALLKHNNHSLFFPSFLWLADLRFFHGNQLPLFLAGLVLLFLTVTLLLIPVWRDETVGLTAKVMATLVVIVGSFWMVRAPITASGGFNSICSLVTASIGVAVLVLLKTRVTPAGWMATLIMVCCGFVASFSFGTGLAIWPTLLFLAWCLRLPWRSFVSLGIAAVATIVIYQQLPPHSEDYGMIEAASSAGLTLVTRLCRLVGSPFFYAASSWHLEPLSAEAAQSSMFSLWCGAAGLVIATVVMIFTMIRRDLSRSSLKLIGLAFVTFNIIAMALVVAGRAEHFRELPFAVAAPRYLFWGTLFWSGLFLIAIQCAETKLGLRWSVYLVALVLPVLAFPEHCRQGLNARWARGAAEYGAVSLINGVRDDWQVGCLGGKIELTYHIAEQLRLRRLDMFADGLQDWIGVKETNLFGGRHKPEGLTGECSVTALVQDDNGAQAARVSGQAWKKGDLIPKILVIIDPTGVVRGVTRSSTISPLINRIFYMRLNLVYLGKLNTNEFVGYIRDYNPQLQYAVRSADLGVLSEEKIPVRAPTTKPPTL